MGTSKKSGSRWLRAIVVSGLLSGAGMAVVAHPVHAQSDPSDPSDPAGPSDPSDPSDPGSGLPGDADTPVATPDTDLVSSGEFAMTGGDSELLLLGALGLAGAAVTTRRYARRS